MSHDARVWVWDHSLSKGTARMVLTLIADRCIDHTCTAYASVPALMRRANASRSAVRDALDKLVASGEIVRLDGRKGPRGETYYRLPEAARFMTADGGNPPHQGGLIPTPEVAESDTSGSNAVGAESDPGVQNPTPGGAGIRHLGGTESDPQNRSEPIGTSRYSSSAPIPASQWQIDAGSESWLRSEGHLARLGEEGVRVADDKWRAFRADGSPRSGAAWGADWRAWITRERSPAPVARHSAASPSGGSASAKMTRPEAHLAALLAALDEPVPTV
ncbi:helix-turn-helix domain-containing protein [Streptomyces sp. wa22]|uniref:Helix-turn-helix domain-containing protein n=1 Tax=Streptomyces glycanivorans TaxID=3033808 RepID=A0ABY9JHM3_9ACTN|nr:helix-turn-helix domain-containing protein [Streptomyces sp. Alt3]TXS17166.1 helix-turn-helix domain-containing protein [Streptomyces sp. wa22]WLQ65547.1 helix-turn-helix domain-containing protein [Streptomyces sp. Alt3]WSQ86296.1 helix-turn-helix domain-containing protein [Streptomyces sp. NBC_01212]